MIFVIGKEMPHICRWAIMGWAWKSSVSWFYTMSTNILNILSFAQFTWSCFSPGLITFYCFCCFYWMSWQHGKTPGRRSQRKHLPTLWSACSQMEFRPPRPAPRKVWNHLLWPQQPEIYHGDNMNMNNWTLRSFFVRRGGYPQSQTHFQSNGQQFSEKFDWNFHYGN